MNRMPNLHGIPASRCGTVATVAIDGAENAALLAIQILAVEDATLAEKLDNARKEAAEKVLAKNKALEEKYAK